MHEAVAGDLGDHGGGGDRRARRIAPDHRDWTYALGEPVKFHLSVTADNTPIDHAVVTYSIGPDLFPGEKKTAPVPLEGLVVDAGTMHTGGFLRLKASVEVAGKIYTNSATAAFAPETITPFQTEPADFDAFWQKGKDELAGIPMEARLTLLPDQCTDVVNVYHVNFRTLNQAWNPQPPRIYGILCEPKAPGKYPAILKVPGAGVRPYAGDPQLAAHGAIVLDIGIHGIPVNLPQELYDQMRTGALDGYHLYNLDNKDLYYYRRVYLSCIRANDFLVSRENYDGQNLFVMGGSQGGQLTIVTTALDSRVKGCAAQFPAYCDVTGYLNGRAGGWPHMFRPNAKTGENVHAIPTKIATTPPSSASGSVSHSTS